MFHGSFLYSHFMHGKNGLVFSLSSHAEEACCLYCLEQEFEIQHRKTVFCWPQNIYVWLNCILLRITFCILLTWHTGKATSNRKGKFNPTNDPFVFLVSSHGLVSTTLPGMFRAWRICSRPGFSAIALEWTLCWVTMATFWQRGILQGWPLCGGARGCPVPDTASSSQLKWTQHSWAPRPTCWPRWDNVFMKGEEMPDRQRRRREQKEWEIAEGTPNFFILTHELTCSCYSHFPHDLFCGGWGPSSWMGVWLLTNTHQLNPQTSTATLLTGAKKYSST